MRGYTHCQSLAFKKANSLGVYNELAFHFEINIVKIISKKREKKEKKDLYPLCAVSEKKSKSYGKEVY